MTLTKLRSISLVYVLRCASSWFRTGRCAGTLFHCVSQLGGFAAADEEVWVLGAGAGDEVESEGCEWWRS